MDLSETFSYKFILYFLPVHRKCVINVADIQEKVFHLSGNKGNICVPRAPNFVERE